MDNSDYDAVTQRVEEQQREITAWSATVADVEAALAGCPEADTLGARVRMVVMENAKLRAFQEGVASINLCGGNGTTGAWREFGQYAGLLKRLDIARTELAAATQRLANLLEGCRALARTLDVHDEITLHDYLAGDDIEHLKQRIVMSHGDEPYYDVATIEELLLREAASMRECDALIALSRNGMTGDAMIAPALAAKGEAEAWLEAALAAATPDHLRGATNMIEEMCLWSADLSEVGCRPDGAYSWDAPDAPRFCPECGKAVRISDAQGGHGDG